MLVGQKEFLVVDQVLVGGSEGVSRGGSGAGWGSEGVSRGGSGAGWQ